MNLPAYHLKPAAFGDVRVGIETIEAGKDTRISFGTTWLAGLAISQDKPGLNGTFQDLELDGVKRGTWTINLTVSGKPKIPEPAHNKRLRLDGEELLDVLNKVDDHFGLAMDRKIWHISTALLVQAAMERNEYSWAFTTPLKRNIAINLEQK